MPQYPLAGMPGGNTELPARLAEKEQPRPALELARVLVTAMALLQRLWL